HLVDLAGVEQHAFGDGGLARVDVGGDADVANLGQVARHNWSFTWNMTGSENETARRGGATADATFCVSPCGWIMRASIVAARSGGEIAIAPRDYPVRSC